MGKLAKYQPFGGMSLFDRLLDDDWFNFSFTNDTYPSIQRKSPISGRVNIIEEDENFIININTPGFKKEDIGVNIEDGYLKVSGVQKDEKSEKTKNYTRNEYYHNSFERSFKLPKGIIEDDIVAKMEDGILSLMIKKKVEEEKKISKTIEIK